MHMINYLTERSLFMAGVEGGGGELERGAKISRPIVVGEGDFFFSILFGRGDFFKHIIFANFFSRK